jgi:hypothetical protein
MSTITTTATINYQYLMRKSKMDLHSFATYILGLDLGISFVVFMQMKKHDICVMILDLIK